MVEQPDKPRRHKLILAGAAAVFTLVIAPVIVNFLSRSAESVAPNLGPQANISVHETSDVNCDFVAPLKGPAITDPTLLPLHPDKMGQMPCDKEIASASGAHDYLILEAVAQPVGDNAVVVTDIRIVIRKQTANTGSALYQPYGTGGGGPSTLTINADVEAHSAIQSVDTYREDGTKKTYPSVRAILPRLTATKETPLVVDFDLRGHKMYTTFDIDIDLQSGSATWTDHLDNGGAGYEVAGTDGLPRFNGYDGGSRWAPGP